MNAFTSFVNSIRALLAIVIAVVILTCTTSLVLLLSPLVLLQCIGIQNPVPFICGWGFRLFDLIVLRRILGVSVNKCNDMRSGIRSVYAHEIVLIIANHPSLAVLFATPSLVWDLKLRGYAAVVKSEFIRRPLLAWLGIPATLAGFAIPINREQRSEALQALRNGVRRLPFGERPFGIVIFPDGSRPTSQKTQESWQRYVQRTGNPKNYDEFTQTLVPKALGLAELIGQLPATQHSLRIIDLTIGFDRHMPHDLLSNLVAMCNATLIVHRTDITVEVRSCQDSAELLKFLMDLWATKNQKLKEWAKPQLP